MEIFLDKVIEEDYGAAHFQNSFSGINTFMPLEFNLNPLYINMAGYPIQVMGESNSQAMWHSFGQVLGIYENILVYDAFSSPGSSGSPVWVYSSVTGLSRVVAINAFGSAIGYGGPRLTSYDKALIEDWMLWEPDKYTLTIEIEGQGTTEPTKGEHTYTENKQVNLKATPEDGWKFEKWIINDSEFEEDEITITMNNDKTATANFVLKQHTVTFHDHDGTKIKKETVEHGSAATPPAEPTREGYTFTGWDNDFT